MTFQSDFLAPTPDTDGVTAMSLIGEIKTLEDRVKGLRRSVVRAFVDEVFATGAIRFLCVVGYTPSFNDGEPCTHCAITYSDVEELYLDDRLDGEVGTAFEGIGFEVESLQGELEEAGDDPKTRSDLCAARGLVWSVDHPQVREMLKQSGSAFEDAVEEAYGTNTIVIFYAKDGKVCEHVSEYYCGW